MRVVLAGLMIALLTLPANAQRARGGHRGKSDPAQSADQKKKALEVDKNYKAALGRIPEAKQKVDPWQKMR